jgi:hypothetical protein
LHCRLTGFLFSSSSFSSFFFFPFGSRAPFLSLLAQPQPFSSPPRYLSLLFVLTSDSRNFCRSSPRLGVDSRESRAFLKSKSIFAEITAARVYDRERFARSRARRVTRKAHACGKHARCIETCSSFRSRRPIARRRDKS